MNPTCVVTCTVSCTSLLAADESSWIVAPACTMISSIMTWATATADVAAAAGGRAKSGR